MATKVEQSLQIMKLAYSSHSVLQLVCKNAEEEKLIFIYGSIFLIC